MTAEKTTHLRKFGLVTGLMFGLMFGLVLPWLFGISPLPRWPWIVTAALALPALVYPALLAPVEKVWMTLAHALGWFNTRVLLGIVYYLVVCPTGLILRLMGKDLMTLKREPEAKSYRIASTPRDGDHMDRPF